MMSPLICKLFNPPWTIFVPNRYIFVLCFGKWHQIIWWVGRRRTWWWQVLDWHGGCHRCHVGRLSRVCATPWIFWIELYYVPFSSVIISLIGDIIFLVLVIFRYDHLQFLSVNSIECEYNWLWLQLIMREVYTIQGALFRVLKLCKGF